jgi:glycosyltransferase involved in cell wall biosynthesis
LSDLDVSVVVPAYNAAADLDTVIRSLADQTLSQDRFETIYVNDGSSDDTGAMLDALESKAPNVRVVHIEPSGAPGRPRNLGLELARGRYVQFLDADDRLAPGALERLVGVADRHRSDIVVEKFASASIPRSQRLFDRAVAHTTVYRLPRLVDSSLALAKLFRRAYLLSHDIRFPEGWRRMEDQAFVLAAYLRGGRITVDAGEPTYFYRRRVDGGHLTQSWIEPEEHFTQLRALLDQVDALGAHGVVRERILRRLLRVEVLGRLAEPEYPQLSAEQRTRLFAAASRIVQERFAGGAIAGFGGIARLRADLARAGADAALLRLTERLAAIDGRALVTPRWDGASIAIDGRFGLADAAPGQPWLGLRTAGNTAFLDLGVDVSDEASKRPAPALAAARAPRTRVDIVLRERSSALEWYVDATARRAQAGDEPQATVPGSPVVLRQARVQPARIGAQAAPLSIGSWDVLARLDIWDIYRTAPVTVTDAVAEAPMPVFLGNPPAFARPVIEGQALRIDVQPGTDAIAAAMQTHPAATLRHGTRLAIELPVLAATGTAAIPAEVVIDADGVQQVIPATLRPRFGRVVVEAGPIPTLPPGASHIRMLLRIGEGGDAPVPIASGRRRADGGITIDEPPRARAAARSARWARWWIGSARERASELAGRLVELLREADALAPQAIRRLAGRPGPGQR